MLGPYGISLFIRSVVYGKKEYCLMMVQQVKLLSLLQYNNCESLSTNMKKEKFPGQTCLDVPSVFRARISKKGERGCSVAALQSSWESPNQSNTETRNKGSERKFALPIHLQTLFSR